MVNMINPNIINNSRSPLIITMSVSKYDILSRLIINYWQLLILAGKFDFILFPRHDQISDKFDLFITDKFDLFIKFSKRCYQI